MISSRLLLLAGCLSMLVLLSGCTAMGYAIGTSLDRSSKRSLDIDGGELPAVGDSVEIELTSGVGLSGRIVEITAEPTVVLALEVPGTTLREVPIERVPLNEVERLDVAGGYFAGFLLAAGLVIDTVVVVGATSRPQGVLR